MKIKYLSKNNNDINDREISEIVKIHLSVYGDDHFTGLFDENLLNKYYLAICRGCNKITALALMDDEVVGFAVAGNGFQEGVNNFIRENILSVIFLLLLNPRFIFERFFNNFINSNKGETKLQPTHRLFSVAIVEDFQGKGVAAKLFEEIESYFKVNNVFCYGLSVRKANIKAIRSYEKLGFIENGSTYAVIYYIKKI